MEDKRPEIPEPLQTKLTETLHEIAQFVHEAVGSSHVIIELQHISDNLLGQGQTQVKISGVGMPMKQLVDMLEAAALKAAEQTAAKQKDMTEEEKKAYVEDLVKQMMNKAKEKGEPK